MNKRKKGFTMVELLATIVVLGIVVVITGYIIFGAIKNARDKSYNESALVRVIDTLNGSVPLVVDKAEE